MNPESEIFKALGDETRLRILNLFISAKGTLCVCEMVDALKLPQYQISKHLVLLKHAGLLDVERKGTWAHYTPKKDAAQNKLLFRFLREFCVGEIFQQDRKNLESRLALREEGKCVVGFVSEKELVGLYRTKEVEPA